MSSLDTEKNYRLIPLRKVQCDALRCANGRRKVVLFESGSLCPPHVGHLSLLNCAKEWLEATMEVDVVAGYLSPHADVRRKFGGEEPLNARQRIELCEALCEDSSWIMVDSYRCFSAEAWEKSFEFRKGPPAHHARKAILELFSKTFPGAEVEVFCLLGDDIVTMIRDQGFFEDGKGESDLMKVWGHFSPIVCIPRSVDLGVQNVHGNIELHYCNDTRFISRHADTPSSTLIRQKLSVGSGVEAEMGVKASAILISSGLAKGLVDSIKTDQDKPTGSGGKRL